MGSQAVFPKSCSHAKPLSTQGKKIKRVLVDPGVGVICVIRNTHHIFIMIILLLHKNITKGLFLKMLTS